MKNPIVLIVGTRPEGIKMMPVYLELKKAGMPVLLVSTGQHQDLLNEVFSVFGVMPDIDLALGKPQQDLAYLTQAVVTSCTLLYKEQHPSLVLVQGDTTTVMGAALAAFYMHIPIMHVEAGLRTNDIQQPFPEEMNRRFLGMIAQYHCAPTSLAMSNLLSERVDRNSIFLTGNTVVDALRIMKEKMSQGIIPISEKIKQLIERAQSEHKKIILLTAHRRESFGGGIARILQATKKLVTEHDDVACIYPYHPNPQVVTAIEETGIKKIAAIHVVEALSYTDLLYTLFAASLVMTDSGGIQEEAISLGKPVVVLREKTEREEGIWHGIAQLVGTDEHRITDVATNMLASASDFGANAIYGDGFAAQKIVKIITSVIHQASHQRTVAEAQHDIKSR